jgi:hypothetical protein
VSSHVDHRQARVPHTLLFHVLRVGKFGKEQSYLNSPQHSRLPGMCVCIAVLPKDTTSNRCGRIQCRERTQATLEREAQFGGTGRDTSLLKITPMQPRPKAQCGGPICTHSGNVQVPARWTTPGPESKRHGIFHEPQERQSRDEGLASSCVTVLSEFPGIHKSFMGWVLPGPLSHLYCVSWQRVLYHS